MSVRTFSARFAIPLLATLAAVCSLAADLPQAPQYLGEIRRNAQGQVITITKPASIEPPSAPATSPAAPVTKPAPPARPPAAKPVLGVVTPQPKRAVTSPTPTSAPHVATLLRVGPTRTLRTIAAAAAIAKNGDTVEIDAGDYVADVATWRQDRLTLRAIGGKVRLVAAGASAQSKAIWVISGGHITIENIIFTGAKVPDHNGAGIRFERGQLFIKNCAFLDNENGILTAGDPQSELTIEDSEFGYNGYGDGYSHNLYAGHIKKLTVTGSYFHHAKVGHLLKTRAAESHIYYNRLTDETGGSASYELEFPNGGLAYVVGNIIQQASTTQNLNVISFGAEGYKWPKNELYLTNNTIADDTPKGGFFLKYQPGLDKLRAANNVLVGQGTLTGGVKRWSADLAADLVKGSKAPQPAASKTADIQTDHNITTGWEAFAQASRYDYRLKPGEVTQFKPVPLDLANGVNLMPKREYVHPTHTQPLAATALLPGAVQTKLPL